MTQVVALDGLLAQRRVWKGHARADLRAAPQPTGWNELDAVLPTAGWPEAALSELLLPADGVGELQLLWPALARLSQRKDAVIALVCPPYRPYPPAWHAAGIRLSALQVIAAANPREALWATEQCLRSGACSAVLGWPRGADDRALRRLQVAAETGQALGFVFRPMKAATNPSPASLRVALEAPGQLRVLKCRGGLAPAQAILIPQLRSAAAEIQRSPELPACRSPAPAAAPRPGLHEVLHGGLRPISVPTPALPAPVLPGHDAQPAGMPPSLRPPASRSPRADAPTKAASIPAPAMSLPVRLPCPASPGTASPVPHGIAPGTVGA
jgi:cell division inhibitor SulA